MTKFWIDATISVQVDVEDEAAAQRIADELESLYLDAAKPHVARFWTKIETERP